MVLICDICRQDISSTGGLNPSICLFPCFHKYCDRCKSQTLSIARQQHLDTNRVTCKLCNQIFPLNVLYDYSENQIEKIFCLHCNIKNKSPVEWSCKSCQNRFLCTQCSQPHYHSGHELEPVKKQNIPLRSQCHSHMNVPATHICSCQMRLCDYCLTIHANGQISNEHQQRIPFTRLAEQARMDLETMRKQSKLDAERIQRFSETLARNKQSIHQQANQARTAVANEMVELVNALIRRGNDIVTYIDMIEESKLKQSMQLENEMRHWMDRLRKIDSFTENALLTVQDDQPGLWSAAMFAQSAIIQVNKRRELAKQSIKNSERAPNIHYQSDISNLANSFRSFGIVNVDGEAKVPTQSTPQNARMFTISNAAQINPTSSISVATSRQVPPNATLRPSPLSIPNNTVNVSLTLPQQQRQPMKLPANQLQPPNVANMPPLHTNLPVNSNSQSFAILPQLLQQPSMLNQPTAVSNCSVPSNSSLPSTPITPLPTPEQLQIMRQHAILAAQQQGPIPNIPTEQQQQAMFIQQKQRQERMAAAAQQQAQQSVTASQSYVQHHVQQQLRSPPIINPQQHPNQQQQYLQQLQLAQHQQMQQQSQQVHRIQQNQQRGPSTLLQQQSPMQLQTPRLNSPILQNAQNIETMPSERPPILLRIPNPRQQIPQNLNTSNESSSTTDMQHMPRMNTPPQNVTLTQILNSPGSQPILSIPSRPLIGIDQPIATSTYPLVQGTSNQLQSQRPGSSIQQMQEKRIPDVVELLDDDEVDRESCQINDDKHKQNSIAVTKGVEERCEDGKQPMNTNIIGATQSSTHQGILQNRQKAQSAAADSTVTSTSTPNNGSNDSRESVSPIDSDNLTNRNGGIKRKTQEPAIMEPISQKRQAVDEHRIVKYKNFDGNEAERTNMNTSPVVISSTTTAENGEMIVNENTTEIETESSVNLNDNSNDARLEIVIENTEENGIKIGNESQTAIAAQDGNNTRTNTNKNDQISDDKGKETQHLQSSSENVLNENISRSREDTTECNDENGTTSSTENETIYSNGEDNVTEDKNSSSIVIAHNKSNGQKGSTKCTIVSPIELMKMATSSHLNLSMNQKERDNSQSTKKEATTKTTLNESYKKGEDKNTSESKTETDEEKNEEEFSNSVTNNSEGIPKLGDGSSDMWDDYCYVCSQGCDDTTGSLGCCETCPHVFHANCHLPKIKGKMEDLPDDWRCSMCIQCEPLNCLSQEYREREKLLCAKVYLACFEENNQVEVFLNEVPTTEVDYHAIIKKPIWLYAIANKVSDGAYNNISEFVDDMNLLFKNFSTFNPPNVMPLASYGKNVYSKYVSAMRKYLPAYQKQIWLYLSLYNHRLSNLGDEDQHQNGSRVGRPPKKLKAGPKSKSKSQTPI